MCFLLLGSRGPENLLDHQMNTERGELSYDRLSDAPRALSDRSLSPPWEQDHRMTALPPGEMFQGSPMRSHQMRSGIANTESSSSRYEPLPGEAW